METVGQGALLVAYHSRHYTYDGVSHNGSSKLAAGEHIVADAYLASDEMFADAMVDAFVVATQDDEVLFHRQVVCHVLVELFSVGRGEYHFVVVALSFQSRDAAVYRFTLHHHAGKSAVWIIVHSFPLVGRVVTQIVQMDFCQSFLLCPCQDRLIAEAFDHGWEHGDNVNSHIFR